MKPPLALLFAGTFTLACGCGATTLRVAIAPTLDTLGRPGMEASVSLGIGTPLDFNHRSRHYLQAIGSGGGGIDGATGTTEALGRADLSYLYWALPNLDIRAGGGYAFRDVPGARSPHRSHAAGGHFGVMPVVYGGGGSNWLPMHVCVGGELRAEILFSDPGGAERGLFSVELVGEINFLAAGD